MSRWNVVRRDCDIAAKTCRTEEGYEASAAGGTLATVSTVAFVAGGVGVIGGAYLLLTVRRPAGAAATGSYVAVTPNSQGIQISGAF
jgi:hypothetical protein